MNGYIKGFFVSLGIHLTVIAAVVFFSTHMPDKPKEVIVIDLSAFTMTPDEEVTELPPTPPAPVQEPQQVVKAPPPPVFEPPKPKPLPDDKPRPIAPSLPEPDAVRYVEATADSVEPTYESNTGDVQPDTSDSSSDGVYAAQAAAESQMRAGYVAGNFNYIQKRIRDHIQYPQQAKRMGLRGKVILKFTINKDGSVRDIIIETSSGHEILDNAGFSAISDAAPFPKPPVSAQIIIPIDFKLL